RAMVRAKIPERWPKGPNALVDPADHPIRTSLLANGIVEFGTRRQHGFDELLGRAVSDRLADRIERNAPLLEELADIEMIFGVPSKAIYLGDDEGLHLSLMLSTEFKGSQERRAIGGLG